MKSERTIVTIPGLDIVPLKELLDYEFVVGTLRPAVDDALRSKMVHTFMSADEYDRVLTAAFHQVWESAVNDRFPFEDESLSGS